LRNREKINSEGEGFFAFKPEPHRFMAFFKAGKVVIITHGFEKSAKIFPRKKRDWRKLIAATMSRGSRRAPCYHEEA
jgi:hypothetical protein